MAYYETSGEMGRGSSAGQLWDLVVLVVVVFITIAAFIVFISTLWNALYPAPEQELSLPGSPSAFATSSPSQSSSQQSSQEDLPKTLSIPSLSISANVQKVGINTKDDISPPSSFTTVGWYEYGPKPGQPGMALIDGHVNNGLGLAGVFLNLDKIQPGADIYVTDTDGNTLHFVVSSVSDQLSYTDHLQDLLANQTSAPQLVLMTCEGTWVESQKTYSQRIVVLANLAPIK